MDKLLRLWGGLENVQQISPDSFSDKISNHYTVGLLSMFALITTSTHFINEPMSCFCPNEWKSEQITYAHKVCWTHNTFYVPWKKQQNVTNFEDEKKMVSYYQWISLILLSQASLFYLPKPMWKMLSKKSGININALISTAVESRKICNIESSTNILVFISNSVGTFLYSLSKSLQSTVKNRKYISWIYGNYLSYLYVLFKIIYFLNSVLQIFLLNQFLGDNYHLYGFDFLKRIYNNQKWSTSSKFPRITMCNIDLRTLGNVHRHSIQCTLPMNLFYELIFLVIWFWICFVIIVSVLSLITWTSFLLVSKFRYEYVYSLLEHCDDVLENSDNSEVKNFIEYYLYRDGCFIIKTVDTNAGNSIAIGLISLLWNRYLHLKEQ